MAVRGEIDRFLMTAWNVCNNPSCYKKRAWPSAGSELNKGNFAAVPTRTSYAPVWLQAQKMQSLRWRDGIVMPRQV